jgi:hypothetical protein
MVFPIQSGMGKVLLEKGSQNDGVKNTDDLNQGIGLDPVHTYDLGGQKIFESSNNQIH